MANTASTAMSLYFWFLTFLASTAVSYFLVSNIPLVRQVCLVQQYRCMFLFSTLP